MDTLRADHFSQFALGADFHTFAWASVFRYASGNWAHLWHKVHAFPFCCLELRTNSTLLWQTYVYSSPIVPATVCMTIFNN
nr:MAG TPA: hypothetical protein [Caudoviricetes sp.]